MSRSASDPAGTRAGFSLIEVLIAMVAGIIIGVGVVRFYRDSYHTYSLQDQLRERDQNAHFVVTRLTEILQQAGSGLPDTGWTMIKQGGGITSVAVNPRNAIQFNSLARPSSQNVPISDAAAWKNTGNVLVNVRYALIDYADPAKPIKRFSIDTNYNTGGFSKGIRDNATGLDSLRLTTAVALSPGDRIYGYREDLYLLSAGNLILRPDSVAAAQMVLAEGIDSLAFTFLNAAGSATTDWKQMRSAKIVVRARSAMPDPRLAGGYRKITLPMNVILRNRL